MEVSIITRKFVFIQGNKDKIELADVNPELSGEQIMGHYGSLYPELTNANIMDKGIVDGFHEIHFQSLAGIKG